MTTSPSDRLNSLFANMKPASVLIKQQVSKEPSDPITEEITQYNASSTSTTSQCADETFQKQEETQRGRDVLTSSDDDEYTAAFAKKPTMRHSEASSEPAPWSITGANVNKTTRAGQSFKTEQPQTLPLVDSAGNVATGHFCPLRLVAKYPYKYVLDENDRVSRHFFANGKFYERSWDIHYLHSPESLYLPPILLVTYDQVAKLVHEINTTLKTELFVPGYPFVISFFDDGTPQPASLGCSKSKIDLVQMEACIPAAHSGYGVAPQGASAALYKSFAAFKAKCERAHAANKRKSEAVKKKKSISRSLAIQGWCMQLKRAQCYFGLRPRSTQHNEPDTNMTWQEQSSFHANQIENTIFEPLDVSKPAPFDFDMQPVIVSVDIESYERAHHLITEIGVSTIDTADLVGLPPGKGGENWMKHIRSRHFRIKGREHLINKDFCIGDPEAFQFGESEFVSLEDAAHAVDSCFRWPFSASFKHDGRLKFHEFDTRANDSLQDKETVEQDDPASNKSSPVAHVGSDETSGTTSTQNHSYAESANLEHSDGHSVVSHGHEPAYAKNRIVLLVGHDVSTDLAYLSRLGSRVPAICSSPSNSSTQNSGSEKDVTEILEVLDTALLYRVIKKESQTRSLTSVLADIERCGWYMHNGGNDARYTLEALVGLVIKARLQEDEETQKAGQISNQGSHGWEPRPDAWTQEKDRRVQERVDTARLDTLEECKAWELAGATGTVSHRLQSVSIHDLDRNENKPAQESCLTPNPVSEEPLGSAKKKSAEEKRREWEMAVRADDAERSLEPCDWAVGGRDGCGK